MSCHIIYSVRTLCMSFIIGLIRNLTVFTQISRILQKKRNKFQLNKILDKLSTILHAAIKSLISWKFIKVPSIIKFYQNQNFFLFRFLTLEGYKKLLSFKFEKNFEIESFERAYSFPRRFYSSRFHFRIILEWKSFRLNPPFLSPSHCRRASFLHLSKVEI